MSTQTKKELEKRIKYFKDRINYYFYDVFHLYDFELYVAETEGYEERAYARGHDLEEGAGMVSIFYSTEWLDDKDTTYEEIDKIAFHETCEALLLEMNQVCESRFIMKKDIPNSTHRVIRRLENTFFNYIKDKK